KKPWRYRNLGLALYRAGRFEEAIQRLVEGQEEAMGWPVLAMAHHRLGQKEKAREWLEKYERGFQNTTAVALAQTSLKVPVRHWTDWAVGQVLRREAKELIEGTPLPENPAFRLMSGRAYARLGERDKAEGEFQAAVAVRPRDPEIWFARARIFLQLGQHDRAEADFAKILELKPDDPRLWIERGRYFAERGQHQKADAHFAR